MSCRVKPNTHLANLSLSCTLSSSSLLYLQPLGSSSSDLQNKSKTIRIKSPVHAMTSLYSSSVTALIILTRFTKSIHYFDFVSLSFKRSKERCLVTITDT